MHQYCTYRWYCGQQGCAVEMWCRVYQNAMLVVKEAAKGSTVQPILLLQHHGPIFHIVNYNHQNDIGVSVIGLYLLTVLDRSLKI